MIYPAALQARRTDLHEAAEIDGTPAWRLLLADHAAPAAAHHVLPSITVLLNSFEVFDIIQVMTGGGPFGMSMTMAYQVYQETFVNNRRATAPRSPPSCSSIVRRSPPFRCASKSGVSSSTASPALLGYLAMAFAFAGAGGGPGVLDHHHVAQGALGHLL
ncbi:hypothetical protein QJS66_11865 [Kocuria rhizophila]|nr:hypothetical protein QJS66_11865 [Kocuria rhizophila]